MPNGADGIHAEFAGGRIGGVGSGEGNVVSGNGGAGIALINVSSAPTKVQGNVVGLKASGDALAPNGAGQVVVSGSDSIDIGGATAAARNVISGGGSSNGILLDSLTHDVLVQGNYIGTDSTGEVGLGNGDGVVVAGGSHDNTIGGSVPGAGNVISASSQAAVRLDLAGTGNRVLGNSIGTDKDETTVLANDIGIELTGTTGTIVGSAVPPIGNVIAGSTEAGVVLDTGSDSNTFAGNYVGTDRTDTADFGNADGMRFQSGGGSNNVDRSDERLRAQRRSGHRDEHGERQPDLGQHVPRQRQRRDLHRRGCESRPVGTYSRLGRGRRRNRPRRRHPRRARPTRASPSRSSRRPPARESRRGRRTSASRPSRPTRSETAPSRSRRTCRARATRSRRPRRTRARSTRRRSRPARPSPTRLSSSRRQTITTTASATATARCARR